MRNTPRPLFADDHPSPTGDEWSLDAAPTARLTVLFFLFATAFAVIVGRVAWLQLVAADRFLAVWDQPVETLEPIPARDGRILSADGQVLAFDSPRFDLLVHYRWLEEPADDAWLTAMAREGLSRQERRQKSKVVAAKEGVLRQRVQLWQAIADATHRPGEELTRQRSEIQTRIQRMLAAVERQRAERQQTDATTHAAAERPGLAGVWDRVTRELTTPPRRERRDPLVIKEQQEYHVVIRDIPLEAVAAIESFPSRFPGVETRVATDRVYPHGDFAAHVIGHRQPLTPDEVIVRAERFPAGDPLDYRAEDRVGRSGIEQVYESVLRGRRGERRITKNRRDEILSSVVVRPPRDGQDVTLTFDLPAQRRAEQLLDASLAGLAATPMNGDEAVRDGSGATAAPVGGCIVAIDVRTGAILTAAAAPRFDLQSISHPDRETWKRLAQDPRRPFFPRVTQGAVPPGSVFKIVTAIAGLQEGAIDPDTPFLCRGYLNRPDRDRCSLFRHTGQGHGEMTLQDALCQSCNVYFFDAAERIAPESLEDWARRFGFGQRTGIDLPGERAGTVPSPRRKPKHEEDRWFPGMTRQLAVGQSTLAATPLQVARFMAAVANGGELVQPHVAQEQVTFDPVGPTATGIELVEFSQAAPRPNPRVEGLMPGTLERIREALVSVVESPQGTGRLVHIDGLAIAGKTGTAENGGGRPDHAWFAGYAPADRPRVAFVVFLEQGGSGGQAAGPIAREFVRTLIVSGQLR